MDMEKSIGELQVGDKIMSSNTFSRNIYEIKRKTKTFAEGVNINYSNDKVKFKLSIYDGIARPKKTERFSTTTYKLINNELV
jgi:hypothetical protein